MIQKEVIILLSESEMKILLKNPLFSELDPSTLFSVLTECECYCKTYSDSDLLRTPESCERGAGLILSGRVSVTTPNAAHAALLRYMECGEVYGIANLFSEEAYVSMIRAVGECRVLHITENAIRRLIETEPRFLYRYLGFLSDRIRFLNRKIGYLTGGSAEQRLAIYLASLGGNTVHLRDSISSLSELLDVGRASLYRAFDRLTEDGYIRKEGRSFTLLDREGMLRAYR